MVAGVAKCTRAHSRHGASQDARTDWLACRPGKDIHVSILSSMNNKGWAERGARNARSKMMVHKDRILVILCSLGEDLILRLYWDETNLC